TRGLEATTPPRAETSDRRRARDSKEPPSRCLFVLVQTYPRAGNTGTAGGNMSNNRGGTGNNRNTTP
ncbi:MAG TPA: hypothetical protein VD861_04740, partial [Pyrinomonadaceae bacterium]|nr:hypothetical protein [Pyrinomonadaceae bacterium]